MSKILILANHYNTLRIFRRELMIALSNAGNEVLVVIPECDEENKRLLESYGTAVMFIDMERRGMNPLRDIKLLRTYKRILADFQPDKVIAYTIKCNIYGGFVCKQKHIPFYANITGLGSSFQKDNFTRRLVSLMYKHALSRAKKVFFENVGNRDTLVSQGVVKEEKTVVLHGAGVNLEEFSYSPYPDDKDGIRFLYVGRIMQEKGADELFEAIEWICKKYPKTVFRFIGWYEDDYKEKVEKLQKEGYIRFDGWQSDVRPYYAECHCVILPSWHEGMSNTLLEGASCGRPLITNKIYGCMEAVDDGVSGYLCDKKSVSSLIEYIEKMILLTNEDRWAMGLAGRKKMEKEFDKYNIVETTLEELYARKILFLANVKATVANFRKEIISAFVDNGYTVVVGYPSVEGYDDIADLGCRLVDLPVSRHGKSILKDIKLLKECKRIIRQEQPDIVLTYTVKPNVYASMACQSLHVPYINNVTGLGSILQSQSILSKLILTLQKRAYKKSSCVFFQNSSNRDRLKELGVISDHTKTRILPGSGVNLQMHSYEEFPEDDGITRFVIVSRVRADKGYGEFLDAAEAIKARHPNTEFHAVGWYEEKMNNRVELLNDNGTIIFHGEKTQKEVHDIIKSCQCLIHPSYHEGMANVLLEAAAAGRPVIASNIPGCREAFDEGVTGFGCEVKSAASLIEAIEKFLATPYEQRIEMGRKGRIKMEKEFDRNFVADIYINEIKRILGQGD